MQHPTCTVPECEKPARSRSATYCKMHYHRWYRHGSVEMQASRSGITASLGRRYKTRYLPHHPLASKHGAVYVHRQVLFDEIGYGPHACHWCGTEIDWLPRGDPRELQPDHLNGDGADNRLENLVPACRNCNTARGSQHRADALRAAGYWSHHDTIARLSRNGRRPRVEPAA